MKGSSVVAGLVLLVVVAVVDGQTPCTSDTCVLAVESSRNSLRTSVTTSSISVDACASTVSNITSAIAGCRSAWTASGCSYINTPLNARLTNVSNYLTTACNALTTCNSSMTNFIQNKIAACQPTSFKNLNISGVLSRPNICRSVQAAIDCITAAAAPCITSVGENTNFELLYDVYLGLWFDCQLTIRGVPVYNNFTAVCSYPTLAKCYNPILSALGKRTVDDNFDYAYLNSVSGLNAFDLFDYTKAATNCNSLSGIDWTSVTSCIQAASVNCGDALGEPLSIPAGDLEDIWDDIFYSCSINLKYLESLKDMCSTGCSNINSRSTNANACPNLLPLANDVLNNAFNTNRTTKCTTFNAAVSCINTNVAGCRLLQEDVYYNQLYGSNLIPIQLATYLCNQALTAKLPWEICRNKQAANEAVSLELYSVTSGLQLKNSMGNGIGSYDYVLYSMRAMYQSPNWTCWQNEATYITKLYPYVALLQTYFSSTYAPKLAGLPVYNLKGTNCNMQGYIQCLSPLLSATGASFTKTSLVSWYPLASLVSGSASDIQPLCSNLTSIDWDTMISCTENIWSSTCSAPVIDLLGDTTATTNRGTNKFYLTDLRAMKTWVSSICMANCSGVSFGISAQQILQCVYGGGTQNRIQEQTQLAILAGFLGQPIDAYCRNLTDLANCLQAINPACSYLDTVRQQLTASSQYSIATAMCFNPAVITPASATTTTTTVAGGSGGSTTVAGGNSVATTKAQDTSGGSDNSGKLRSVVVAFLLSSLVARFCSLRHG